MYFYLYLEDFMKFKRLILCLALITIVYPVYTQKLTNLDFGTVVLGATSIGEMNFDSEDAESLDILSAEIVGHNDIYSIVDFSPVKLNKNENLKIKIQIKPKDNVQYRSFLKLKIRNNKYQYTLMAQIKSNVTHSNDIYKGSDNLKGVALINWLSNFVKPHTSLSYNDARNAMWGKIDNVGGQTECIYTGRKVTTSGTPNANETNFDTEHTWPQSLGASQEPPRSDLFHIRPTYRPANNKRANIPFGYVQSNITYEDGGSKLGNSKYNSQVFEPRDIVKGDIARGMYYFAVRYGNPSNYIDSQEEDLKQFALNDPVDAKESARNDSIFKYQKNRNPFIDNENFLYRFKTISSPELNKSAQAFISDNNMTLFGVNNNRVSLFIANHGDTTVRVTNHSFNQYNNGHSYRLKLQSEINGLEIAPNSLAEVVVYLDAEELVLDDWQADLNIFFDNSQLLPVTFNILKGITSVNDKLSDMINIYPNPSDERINISIPLEMLYSSKNFSIVTIDGRKYDVTKKVNYQNGIITIEQSELPCSNCMIYFNFNYNNQTITKPVVIK